MDNSIILALLGVASTLGVAISGTIAYLYKRDAKRSDEAIHILNERSSDCERKHEKSEKNLKKQQSEISDLSQELLGLKMVNEMICPQADCPKARLSMKATALVRTKAVFPKLD